MLVKIWKGLSLLLIVTLMLAACAPAATPAPTAQPTAVPQPTTPPRATEASQVTEAPQATEALPTVAPQPTEMPTAAPVAWVSQPSGKKAASGFDCPAPQPKMDVKSTTLNLFVWTEYIPQDILDCFEAVYGIKINRDEYSSNEEMYAKVSKGSTNYDILQPSADYIEPLVRQNIIQKLDKSKLSIMGYFAPQYLNLPYDPGNEYTVPYEFGTDAVVYNSDKVSVAPTSWADLWKPEYKDLPMVLLDSSHDIIGATLVSLGYDPNTSDPKQLDEAKTKLAELVPSVKLFDSDSPKTALIAGDVVLGITWTGDAFISSQKVPAIKYVYPKEGPILWQDNYVIPATAPHADAAYAWLNYSMQPDLFWLMLRDFQYTNPNQAALDYAKGNQMPIKDADGNDTTPDALYRAYIESLITNTPPDVIKSGHWLKDLGDAAPAYDKIWTEVKGQ